MFASERESICRRIRSTVLGGSKTPWTPVIFTAGRLDIFRQWKKKLEDIEHAWIQDKYLMLREEESGAHRDAGTWELCFCTAVMTGLLALVEIVVEENWENLRTCVP